MAIEDKSRNELIELAMKYHVVFYQEHPEIAVKLMLEMERHALEKYDLYDLRQAYIDLRLEYLFPLCGLPRGVEIAERRIAYGRGNPGEG